MCIRDRCSAVFTDRDTGVGADDLDIQLRITNGVADLLKRSACGEHGKGRRKRNFTAGGQTGSNADHVALCDAAVKEAFRVCFFEDARLGGSSKVCIQNDDLRVFSGERGNGCLLYTSIRRIKTESPAPSGVHSIVSTFFGERSISAGSFARKHAAS